MIRVLVVDDQALLRGSFRLLVDSAPDLETVGEAGTGLEAVELAVQTRPDVVLMDVRMPELDGIAATRRICAHPDAVGVRVLILTTFDLDEYVYAGLRAGASGFLLKNTPPAELLAAIRVIAAGEALLAPSVTRRLIAAHLAQTSPATGRPATSRTTAGRDGAAGVVGGVALPGRDGTARVAEPVALPGLAGVTEREREVLAMIGRGLSNAEIAQGLFLSAATVKTHVGHLLAKLSARDRAQLVIAAYESGLITVAR